MNCNYAARACSTRFEVLFKIKKEKNRGSLSIAKIGVIQGFAFILFKPEETRSFVNL